MKTLGQPIIPARSERPERAMFVLGQGLQAMYKWLTEFIMEYSTKIGDAGRRAHTIEMPDKRGTCADHDSRYLRVDAQNYADFEEITIAGGEVTATQPMHTVDTEGDAASDNLDTINQTDGAPKVLYLKNANSGRDVVLKHGTGNIVTRSGSDVTLTGAATMAHLVHDGANWLVVNEW